MPISGLHLIPRAEKGDILVPKYSGSEDPKAAVQFLTLWSSWAIQMGFSYDLTRQLLEEYIKKALNLPYAKVCKTWKEYVDNFYERHRVQCGVEKFEQWYDECAAKIPIVWFSYAELERATERFSKRNWVGQGSVGMVYKAHLPNGQMVAVKAFKDVKHVHLNKVLDEVCRHRRMTQATHPNVVHLIGFCTNARNPLMVYNFVGGGNLRHHLEGVYGDQLANSPLIRLIVAIDVANAIVQLHHNGPWPIFHRDVRSTNILLTSDFRAKLTDLGLSVDIKNEADKHTPPPMSSSFSQGYVDPVYEHTQVLHNKTDVYSYGVVLMELVTHMKVWDASRSERSLPDLIVTRTRGAHPYSVINPGKPVLPGKDNDYHGGGILERMLHVAVWCCDANLERRPTIVEVADYLQEFQRLGSRRQWIVNSDLVGDQRGRLGWEWDHPSPITSPRDPD